MIPPSPRLDLRLADGLHRAGPTLLRLSLAVIFGWFGLLKVLALGPCDELVARTVTWFDPAWFVPTLGCWEMAIGLGLCWRPLVPAALALLFLQMPGTFLPLLLVPERCFTVFPVGLTLEGQYIVKNLALVSAALVVAAATHAPRSARVPAA